jgi:hypothetical protein
MPGRPRLLPLRAGGTLVPTAGEQDHTRRHTFGRWQAQTAFVTSR